MIHYKTINSGVYLATFVLLLLSMVSYSVNFQLLKNGIKLFPITESNNKSTLFSLKAESNDVFVNQYKNYNYAHFEAGSPINCRLTSKEPISKIIISPRKNLVSVNISGNNAEFKLPKPGYYVVRINEKHKLFIFVDALKLLQRKRSLIFLIQVLIIRV